MSYAFPVLLTAAAVFLAVLLSLSVRPKTSKTMTGVMIWLAVATGLLINGLALGTAATTPSNAVLAVLQAAFNTAWMFTGRENLSELCAAAPWLKSCAPLQVVYWIGFLCAIYTTASAVLEAIGRRLVCTLRELTLPWHKICLIYGGGTDALECAKILQQKVKYYPVFIDSKVSESEAVNVGGILWDTKNFDGDGKWLKRLRIRVSGSRVLEVLCLHEDDAQTKIFLERLLPALRRRRISARQTHISVVCRQSFSFDFLRDANINGEILCADVFSLSELTAEKLIEENAPWTITRFDGDARSQGHFRALIVGFDNIGQAVLRELVRNAQFVGGSFSADVIDTRAEKMSVFRELYPDMVDRYNITFHNAEGVDRLSLLLDMAEELRYIVVCTGNDEENRNIVDEILSLATSYPKRFGGKTVVARCNREGFGAYTMISGRAENEMSRCALDPEKLILGHADSLAITVNSAYLAPAAERIYTDAVKREAYYRNEWYKTNIYSRKSSRATALFCPAMYAAAGLDIKQASSSRQMEERLREPQMLENLSKMEHLRWNAFQSTMGVSQMTPEEYSQRIREARNAIEPMVFTLAKLQRRAENGESVASLRSEAKEIYDSIRAKCSYARRQMTRTGLGGIHSCLTDWESLDSLWLEYEPLDAMLKRAESCLAKIEQRDSAENSMAKSCDFKQLDTNMVFLLPHLGEAYRQLKLGQ